jgi:hypothetical protein
MPTPGGLPRAGDRLINDGVLYVITQRTSTSAPFSVWVERYDGLPIVGKMAMRSGNLRNRGREYRVSCETGQLPGGWHYFKGETPAESAAAAADEILGAPVKPAWRDKAQPGFDSDGNRVIVSNAAMPRQCRVRPIRVEPCKRPNLDQGEEVDVRMQMNEAQATVMTMSDDELMDMAIRALIYLRDKADGSLA